MGVAKTADQLNSEVLSFLASGTEIRATTLRQVLLDIIASTQPPLGTLAGPLQFLGGPTNGNSGAPGVFRALVPGDMAAALQGVQPRITVGLFTDLATCTSAIEGTLAGVSDSSTATWGATVTGSSTNHVLAYCDGTNWTVAAD